MFFFFLNKLEYSSERIKLLQSNAEGYKKETKALREKNQKHTENIIKHEHVITILRQVNNLSVLTKINKILDYHPLLPIKNLSPDKKLC